MRTRRFWQAVERLHAGATAREWSWEAGFDVVAELPGWLQPTGRLATSWPVRDPQGVVQRYRVVEHARDDFVAVGDEIGESKTVPRRGLTLLTLDLDAIRRQLAACFDLAADRAPVGTGILPVGTATRGGKHVSMCLALAHDADGLRDLCDGWMAGDPPRSAVLTPTRDLWSETVCRRLRGEGHALAVLAECTSIDDGRLQSTIALDALLGVTAGNACVFRKEGETWRLSYEGKTVSVADVVGLHYLRELLAQPGIEIGSTQLVERRVGLRATPGSRQEAFDADARNATASRLRELQSDLASAEQTGDHLVAAEAREERDKLLLHWGKSVGLGQRTRELTAGAGRARTAVANAITTALKRLAAQHPELASHLEQSIQRGASLCYRPATAISWETS